MKNRLKVVSKTKNRRVRATAEKIELVKKFTAKIITERKTPALKE